MKKYFFVVFVLFISCIYSLSCYGHQEGDLQEEMDRFQATRPPTERSPLRQQREFRPPRTLEQAIQRIQTRIVVSTLRFNSLVIDIAQRQEQDEEIRRSSLSVPEARKHADALLRRLRNTQNEIPEEHQQFMEAVTEIAERLRTADEAIAPAPRTAAELLPVVLDLDRFVRQGHKRTPTCCASYPAFLDSCCGFIGLVGCAAVSSALAALVDGFVAEAFNVSETNNSVRYGFAITTYVTTIPPTLVAFYLGAKRVFARPVVQMPTAEPVEIEEESKRVCQPPPSKAQKVSQFVLGPTSVLCAGIPLIALLIDDQGFPWFLATVGGFFLVDSAVPYYKHLQAGLQNLIRTFSIEPELYRKETRQNLKGGIEEFRRAVASDDELVRLFYAIMFHRTDDEKLTVVRTSGCFAGIRSAGLEAGHSNRVFSRATLSAKTLRQYLNYGFPIALMTIGGIAGLRVEYRVLNRALESFASPLVSAWTSGTIATLLALRTIPEGYGFSRLLNSLGDPVHSGYPKTRKLATFISLLQGVVKASTWAALTYLVLEDDANFYRYLFTAVTAVRYLSWVTEGGIQQLYRLIQLFSDTRDVEGMGDGSTPSLNTQRVRIMTRSQNLENAIDEATPATASELNAEIFEAL